MKPIRILFPVFADADNFNAQARNAQEIGSRLPRDRFVSTFFYLKRPDPVLAREPHLRYLKLPQRFGSLQIAKELVWGRHDFIFYLLPGPAARLYWALAPFGRKKQLVAAAEGSAAQIDALPSGPRSEHLKNFGRAVRTYAITDHIRDSMRDLFPLEVEEEVIPVGVDLQKFQPFDRSHHKPPWKVVFVGSLMPRKQPEVFLELARRLAGEPVEFHLVGGALGNKSYFDALEDESKRDGLDQVIFHGPRQTEQVLEHLQEADIFLLPSHHEGLPKVSLESAATGLPCLVFDDYQTPSVVDGKTGFQVKTLDEMTHRLRQMIADHELRNRLGQAGIRHAQRFDWQIIADRWQEIFTELRNQKA